jgi:hypothetical protein
MVPNSNCHAYLKIEAELLFKKKLSKMIQKNIENKLEKDAVLNYSGWVFHFVHQIQARGIV